MFVFRKASTSLVIYAQPFQFSFYLSTSKTGAKSTLKKPIIRSIIILERNRCAKEVVNGPIFGTQLGDKRPIKYKGSDPQQPCINADSGI